MQLRGLELPLATALLGSLLGGLCAAAAQSSAPAPRVLADWRGSPAIPLAGSKPPLSAAAIDLGPAPDHQFLGRMLLLLAPAPAGRQALAAELASLQSASSPNRHHWLTPQAFAQSCANNPADVAAVAAWLGDQGLAVAPLPSSLGWIEFSGTVAQVQQAFGAQIHLFSISGSRRAALTTAISVPRSLAPVIAGLVSLDGALADPALTAPQPLAASAADLASLTSPAGAPALTPALAAQLLDAAPLAAQGLDGTGQTVAVLARSSVNSADVAAFRSAFALSVSPLQIAPSGPDPGLTADQPQATLAASWAGAAAPGAQIQLLPAASTSATDGVDLALAAAVDRASANVVVVPYSICEAALSSTHQAFYAALYQQAAAEGITIVAAAGDGGAAACTPAGGVSPVDTGLGVNALAATPWNIVAGVAAYGAAGPAAAVSALTAWSPVNSAGPVYSPAKPAYAGGGGSSSVYSRPSWQPLSASLAGDGAGAATHRLLPDLALPTALDSGVNPGLAFCLGSSGATSGCTLMRSGGSGVAAAYFAGVAALINQKNGAQGNLAPALYATSLVAGVFNDVTQGAATLACVSGSPACGPAGLIGYSAGSGFDLATGLGVPDVRNLVTELAKPLVTGSGPTITLAVSPVLPANTYNPSAIVKITATVVDPSGAGIPAGSVVLLDSNNYDLLTPAATLTSSGNPATGSNATFTVQLSQLYNYPVGSFVVPYSLGIGYDDPTGAYSSVNDLYLLNVTSQMSSMLLTITPTGTAPGVGSTINVTVTLGVAAGGPPAGSVPPTGSITLSNNGVVLGTAPVSTAAGITSAIFSLPVAVAANSLVASYSGDDNYAGATSLPYVLTAGKVATTVVLTSNTATPQPGQSVVLYATVSAAATPPAGSEQNPGGLVAFYNGSTLIGTSVLTPEPGSSSSLATLTTQTLSGGSDSLTAVYQGDAVYGSSTSNLLSALVQGFTLTASPSNPATNLNLVKGAAGSESFIVTGIGGYTGTVQVICSVPAQDDMSCTASPQQVTPTSTVTFVVQTYATGGPAYAAAHRPRLPAALWPRAAGGAMLAGAVFFLLPFPRRLRRFSRLGSRRVLILLLLLGGLAGVGVGCTSSTTATASSGTPLGVATFQVTATAYVDNAVVAQSLNFTVNVQPQ